jgi:lipoprotein-releasing system permease protein
MRYELFIGLRYLRSKKRQAFVSVIGLISILGVIIGVMSLNVVLSVMKGFEDELRDKILGVNAHIVVLSYNGAFEDYKEVKNKLLEYDGVLGASPFIYGQGMLVADSNVSGAVIRGIDKDNAGSVTSIQHAIGKGSYSGNTKKSEKELEKLGGQIIQGLGETTDTGNPLL